MASRVLDRAVEIVQQLVLQGHPVPLNILLLRKSLLTPDGIMRQLTFNAWLETLARIAIPIAAESVITLFISRSRAVARWRSGGHPPARSIRISTNWNQDFTKNGESQHFGMICNSLVVSILLRIPTFWNGENTGNDNPNILESKSRFSGGIPTKGIEILRSYNESQQKEMMGSHCSLTLNLCRNIRSSMQ